MAKRKAKKKPSDRTGRPPEGDKRLTVNLDAKIHKKLKLAAVERETTVGEILEELVRKHLK